MKPSPTLTLWRPQPEGHATALLEALITPSARRKQQLMGEDCITLDFLHDQLVELSVGDYVDTDYGRFYVATPQRATFEAETAVYHYLITLEAPHRLWGTHLMALCVAQSEGSYVRTDKQWTLTAPLSQHLDQLVANLKILGIAHPDGSNWDYVVHQESFLHTNATAARTLVYDGCSLLQALDLLASEEAYHCEWWIDGHTIHFGQLGTGQASAATIVQGRDGHFERDKESLIATRHYVVGGTTNLPNTYRRKLIFEADGELLKRGIIHDPARPLRPTFFSNFDKGLQERKVEHRFSMEQLKLFTSVGVVEGRNDDPNADDYDPNVPSEQGEDHRQADVVLWSDEQARFTFKEGVHYNLDAKGLRLLSQQQPKGVMGETAVLALAWQALPHEKGADVVEVDGKRLRIFFRLGGAGTFDAVDTQYPTSTTRQGLYLLTTDSFLETPETADLRIEGSVKLYYAEPAAQMRLRVSVPSAGIDKAEARYADTFTDNAPEHSLLLVDEGLRGQLPSINSEFVPHGLVSAKIPLSYYIPEHHIEGLGAAPANSLRLPLEAYPNGYIDLPADATEAQRVERVLALPHIFPRLEMNVGEVVVNSKVVKPEEGSAQPHFSITDASNSLPFESSLRIEGVALRVKFESGALGGMEFAITPDFTNKRFAITPNENYGAMLPNATLRPVSGDKFVLLGFNPEVLANGGLVEAAERELERVAREIIEQEQALSQSYELTTLPPLNPLDDAPIYRLGQSLTLSDDGSSTKPLRIVGVDHALDIPQDAPRYRLAQPRKPSLTQRLKEVGTAKASGTKVVTAGQVGGNNGRSFSTSSSSVDIDALREEMGEHFLSRLSADVALGHITFNNGLTAKQLASFEKGATFGSYLPSLIGGRGAKIDERGNAEVESIKVRSRMEVAELVVNRQTTMDADFLLTEGDLVENVKEEANGQFTLTLRREWEGYVTSLTAGAVVRGIYNDTSRGGSTFETTWLKVEQVNTANNAIRVSLYPANECPAGVNHPPRKLLKISRWGHTIDATRQATYLLSSREQRVCLLTNVTKPIIDASNISSWQGKLDGLTWRDAGGQTHQLTGYGNVMGDAYVRGSLHVGGELTGAIADELDAITNKVELAKIAADDSKRKLDEITADAYRDGIITEAEGMALAKAKLETLIYEKKYMLARANAVLASHPQLAKTHPNEYRQIIEGNNSNQNARWNYLLYAETMISVCKAFINKTPTYHFKHRIYTTASKYEQLFSEGFGTGYTLSALYVRSRDEFETAIVKADRGKDGRDGQPGRDGEDGRDAKPPRVSAGGTWEVWSWEQNAYIDTNDPARGESGENGLAPRINSSGYWEVYENGSWRQTSIKAKGQDGQDGQGCQFIYFRKNNISPPPTPSGDRPSGWTTEPQGVTISSPFEFISQRTGSVGAWSAWSRPKLWAKYGADGKPGKNGSDGRSVDEVKPQYAITSSATSPPNNNSDVGWSDTPIPWREGFALWTRQKTTYTDGRVNYSTPILDNSWSGERLRRLMEDDLAVSKVSVGAEKGVAFAGRFLACENDGGNRVVRAFFNGQTSGTRPAFAAGVNHFGEDGESYSTAFYHNGSGHIGVLSFDNIGGAGSLHIFDRNDARKKLVELTDKPMPDAVQMAKENRVEVKYGRNGNFNQTFTGVNAGEPLYLGPDSSGWDGRGEIFSKPTDPEYDRDGLSHDRYDVYQIIPQWGVYNVDGNLRIPDGNPTGAMSGNLSIRVTPDATRQGFPYAYDSFGRDCPNDRVAVYLINYSDGPRGYKLWDNGKDGELMSGDVNLSFLKDIVPGEYQLQVIITSYVGRPKVNISGSGVSYFIDPNRPYTAICGDGFMAYQSQQQYTFIKDGVLHAKGEIRMPGLLAAGVVEANGHFRSSWGSRLGKVEHRSRGEYLIHHTLGHTRYSVIVNPLGNGGLKVAQLAVHAGHVAWIYIKDVQSGCQMSDSMFTFAIIGHDD